MARTVGHSVGNGMRNPLADVGIWQVSRVQNRKTHSRMTSPCTIVRSTPGRNWVARSAPRFSLEPFPPGMIIKQRASMQFSHPALANERWHCRHVVNCPTPNYRSELYFSKCGGRYEDTR